MDVLIIGGTQFIGKCIVRKLLERGLAVTIFTRGRARPAFWKQVEHIIGDRRDEQRFEAQLAGRRFDAVIDTIAYDAAAVSAALRTFTGRIGHYLLCSSGAVYRDYPDWRQYRPVYEHDADLTYTGDLAYAEGKRAAEQVLMKHDLQIECAVGGLAQRNGPVVCARVPGSSLGAFRRSSAGDRSRTSMDERNVSRQRRLGEPPIQ
jgi:nucleoside-diphosphate-sugar epimerase